jgi:predicted N-acetyltransferase YhbS
MVDIQTLRAADLPIGLQMSRDAGWNQTLADWRRFLKLAPQGCFRASVDDRLVGTVTTCQFGEVGWIGMMLVGAKWRRQGIGRALLQGAIQHLEANGATTIRLDATPAGMPLYETFGFQEQFLLHRYTGTVVADSAVAGVRAYRDSDDAARMALDARVIGYDRRRLLEALQQDPLHRCLVFWEGSTMLGYAMSRPGSRASFLGPCVAERDSAGCQLLSALLQKQVGQQVYLDVPQFNQAAVATLARARISPERPLLRMARGQARRELVTGLFASSGPEKG